MLRMTTLSPWPWFVQGMVQLKSRPIITTQDPLSQRDAIPATMFTCGYRDGDPAQGWPAPSGYDCRVDTAHGIWGFCPTTVIEATDCGLGGYCFDTNTCTSGCGSLSNNPVITTWTWYGIPVFDGNVSLMLMATSTPSDPQSRYCSMAFLTFGVDQTYEYFHCGPEASTAHLLAFPTAGLTISKSTITSSTSSPSPGTAVGSPPTPTSTPPSTSPNVQPSTSPTGQPISSNTTSTTTPPTASNANQNSVSNSKNNTGAIIGGVIGGLALICGFGGIVVYLLVRARLARAGSLQQTSAPGQRTPPLHRKTYHGGWGPSELSSHEYHVRSPVELPGDTSSFR
jgi:hypothetical protein